ncbi:MAG TPA: flagellar hook-basal body complex protein [Tepidisphaeraceae bacterium]|jgi:flagellar hook protein FlgE
MSGLDSALYTGLSGLSVNQQQLAVIGNNIANSNTTAFKSSRVLFTTEAYVTTDPGSPASSNFGGTNPSQTGLGATIGSIETDFTPGSIQTTGQDTDMAINGSGFFIAQSTSGQQFTRDGAFTLNSNNQLVTTNGAFVQGYGVDSNYNVVTSSLQNITIPLNTATTAQQTQNASFGGNLNASGSVSTTGSVLTSGDITTVGGSTTPTSTTLLTNLASAGSPSTPLYAVGDTLTVNADQGGTAITPALTFTVTSTSTLQDLQDFTTQGLNIDTTATPPTGSPTPGVSLVAGTAPNSVDLNIVGNSGTVNALTVPTGSTSLFKTSGSGTMPAFSLATAANGMSIDTGDFKTYDSLGNTVNVNVTATLESTSSTGTVWQFIATSPNNSGASTFAAGTPASTVVGAGTITFNSNGQYVSSTGGALNISRAGTGATDPMQVTLNFGNMTAVGEGSATDASTFSDTSQDGAAIGTLQSFTVGDDGTIQGTFSNGIKRTLGQIATATFSNEEGLTADGNNMYSASSGSGQPVVGAPGTLGSGEIAGGALEQSNVDLSTEFTNLIMASTGFSASSRVITTADQLVQDLLNSNR